MEMRSIPLFLMLILASQASSASAQTEPIRILGIGTVMPTDTPLVHWCTDEPLMTCKVIPTRLGGATYDEDETKRLIRLYFPRRLDKTTVDILHFSAGDVVHLTTSQIASMIDGVSAGVSAFADVGGTSVIQASIDSWIASGIEVIFPNDASAVVAALYSFTSGGYPGYFLREIAYTINVRDEVPGNPFIPFVDVGIEGVHGRAGRNMIAKPGSSILATVAGRVGFLKEGSPFAMAWDYDLGRTLTVCEWLGHPFWSDYGGLISQSDNAYAAELFVNLMLHLTDRPLFQNVAEIHQIKEAVKEYRLLRGNVIAVVDFASTFGANMAPMEDDLDGIEEKRRSADATYLEGDYPQAAALIKSANQELQQAFKDSVALKNRALTSVYISEWLAVTGTMVVSLSVVHETMIRRRAYRSVRTTRSG